ncbi:unnamed protein product [Rotaria socialis]
MTHRQMCFEISDQFKKLCIILAAIGPEQEVRGNEEDLELLFTHLYNATNKAIIIFERCQDNGVLGRIKNIAQTTQIRDQLKAIKINLEVITGLISVVFQMANKNEQNPSLGIAEKSKVDESIFKVLEDINIEEEEYIRPAVAAAAESDDIRFL